MVLGFVAASDPGFVALVLLVAVILFSASRYVLAGWRIWKGRKDLRGWADENRGAIR